MCGTCETVSGKIACVAKTLGILSMILAVLARLVHFYPLGLGPRSFAAGAALMFLFAIANRSCSCHTHAEEKKQ